MTLVISVPYSKFFELGVNPLVIVRFYSDTIVDLQYMHY